MLHIKESYRSKIFQQLQKQYFIFLSEFITIIEAIFLNSTYLFFSSSCKEGNT